MQATSPLASSDLAGVIVGETALSDVQGDSGSLNYRGTPIADLADKPFLIVVWYLLTGDWPTDAEHQQLAQFMRSQQALNNTEIALLQAVPEGTHPMLVLQGLIPLLNPVEEGPLAPAANQGLAIAAKISALIAALFRKEQGLTAITELPETDFHRRFLFMLRGELPRDDEVATLDTTQILQMEHSCNAGTFAGRVCASTEAPLQSVISASVGTLYGRLHGGADQAALAMAREIGDPAAAAKWVNQRLAQGQKIMGMGHREYRTLDPRAAILKPMALARCTEPNSRKLLDTLVAVEEACQAAFAERGREIHANVEFYKGAVFNSLGIPDHYFTALFAMARVYGYIAHFLEFKQHSRLIRPRAKYIGTVPSQ